MKITQPFRIRKDIESYIAFFRSTAPLEMTEVAAFISKLLKVNKTTEELIKATHVQFPEIDARQEVEYTIQTLHIAGVLDGT